MESASAALRTLSRRARTAARSTWGGASSSFLPPQAARPRTSPRRAVRASALGATGLSLRTRGLDEGADLEAGLEQCAGAVTQRLGLGRVRHTEGQVDGYDDALQAGDVGEKLSQLVEPADHGVL